jgi:pimeloyl-ACP methyl ester carboxylesterase
VDRAGGGRVLLSCEGPATATTVVLDAGLGNDHVIWGIVQQLTARAVRVCSWDRPGLGRSSPLADRADAGVVTNVAIVRDALRRTGAPGPYLLVGASYGGLDVQYWARTRPGEVRGVVLVDALHPDLDLELLRRGLQTLGQREEADTDVGEQLDFDGMRASARAVRLAPPLPDVPLVVLQHGNDWDPDISTRVPGLQALWEEMQNRLRGESGCSALLRVPGTGHRIHGERPVLLAAVIARTRAVAERRASCDDLATVDVDQR